MTPELAAERAAQALDKATELRAFPEESAALVAVADGWTRLHTALAASKTIEPGQVEPAPDLRERAREWISGFHATTEEDGVNMVALLLSAAADAYQCGAEGHRSGIRLALPHQAVERPTVRVYNRDYEVAGWDYDRGSQADGVNPSLRLKLDFI